MFGIRLHLNMALEKMNGRYVIKFSGITAKTCFLFINFVMHKVDIKDRLQNSYALHVLFQILYCIEIICFLDLLLFCTVLLKCIGNSALSYAPILP